MPKVPGLNPGSVNVTVWILCTALVVMPSLPPVCCVGFPKGKMGSLATLIRRT